MSDSRWGCLSCRRPSSLSLSLSPDRVALDNFFEERESVLITDALFEDREQDIVVHALEELLDIALQNEAGSGAVPTDLAHHSLQRVDAPVRAVADAAGEGGRDEGRLEDRVQDREDGVVEDAVPHRRLVDVPLLGVADVEPGVGTVAIRLALQLQTQREDVPFQVPFKAEHVAFVPLVGFEGVPCAEQVLRRDDGVE